MTTKTLFQKGSTNEQKFHESRIIEAIQIFGHDIQYVRRDVISEDELFGEDLVSEFTDSHTVEMYVENTDGYEGQDIFSKFGYEIEDSGTLVVSKKRFDEAVGQATGLVRPREGDLVVVPFSRSLFEIKFVEHEEPFYQLGHLPIWKLRIELFDYNQEDIDIPGIDVSRVESYGSQTLTLGSAGVFTVGETVTQVQTSGTVTGEVVTTDGNQLVVSGVSSDSGDWNVFESGFDIVGETSGLTRTVTDVDDMEDSNEDIEDISSDIVILNPKNPFGNF